SSPFEAACVEEQRRRSQICSDLLVASQGCVANSSAPRSRKTGCRSIPVVRKRLRSLALRYVLEMLRGVPKSGLLGILRAPSGWLGAIQFAASIPPRRAVVL